MKIVFALVAVFTVFVASTALAFTRAPSPVPCAVAVPDAPVAAPSYVEPAAPVLKLHEVVIVGTAPKATKRSNRVWRCETRALQMGTYGDTVQDCYWHDR